ncbi:hypothetical protein AMJ49_04780 [Parcubacteria bacterium DG_74_2]|nr:MAG: hypothetical protein AMJ49_04780 [Parcubacteria bacterium DG_74_2]
MTKKISLNFIIFCLTLGSLYFVLNLSYNQNKVSAQELFCSPEIPIGESMEKTAELLDGLMTNLQIIEEESQNQIDAAQLMVNKARQCNPNVCHAKCVTVTILIRDEDGNVVDSESHCSPCTPCSCVQDPCPNFEAATINKAKNAAAAISTAREEIELLIERKIEPPLNSPAEICPLPPSPENPACWTKKDFAIQALNKARQEFDNCYLTPLQWKQVNEGTLSPKHTTRCRTVLELNLSRERETCKSLLNYFCCQ